MIGPGRILYQPKRNLRFTLQWGPSKICSIEIDGFSTSWWQSLLKMTKLLQSALLRHFAKAHCHQSIGSQGPYAVSFFLQASDRHARAWYPQGRNPQEKVERKWELRSECQKLGPVWWGELLFFVGDDDDDGDDADDYGRWWSLQTLRSLISIHPKTPAELQTASSFPFFPQQMLVMKV